MPVFFASNAIYPIDLMPRWLRGVSLMIPLSYEVDGLRATMLRGGETTFGVGRDFAALLLAYVILVVTATRMYPRMTE